MTRISRPHMWMQVAEVAAMRATCYRGNTGAAVIKDKKDILAIGYNGPPSGEPHCLGNDCPLTPEGGCQRSLHAEANAIERSLDVSQRFQLLGCELYCTSAPCISCAYKILEHGIHRMFYRNPYRIAEGLTMVRRRIDVFRITPSGIIIDEGTGKIVDPDEL